MKKYFLSLAFLMLQVMFWINTKDIKANLTVVPRAVGMQEVEALSFGDKQFYFRYIALLIQNAGDSFGSFAALSDYNYKDLSQWFYLMDHLDSISDFTPSLASYYYGQTQNTEDVRYVVSYLKDHSKDRIEEKWWWMVQGAYLSYRVLRDMDLALELSSYLDQLPEDTPVWAKYLTSILLLEKGDKEKSYEMLKVLARNIDDLSDHEKRFVEFFIKNRLGITDE